MGRRTRFTSRPFRSGRPTRGAGWWIPARASSARRSWHSGPGPALVTLDVAGVDFDAYGLADQVDGQHQARLRFVLAQQPADDAAQRAVYDPNQQACANHRTGIELQIAADQNANAFKLVFGNRRGLAFERHDVHDSRALQDAESVLRVKARKAVARKQRPVDLLLPVLPAAPARDGGEKCRNVLAFELLPYDLFMPGARPHGVPLRLVHR